MEKKILEQNATIIQIALLVTQVVSLVFFANFLANDTDWGYLFIVLPWFVLWVVSLVHLIIVLVSFIKLYRIDKADNSPGLVIFGVGSLLFTLYPVLLFFEIIKM